MTGHRILIADDNADSADSMALLLGFEGHEVRCARDGIEALRLYEEFQPDVVLLDISMPRMDGREVARRIRALDIPRKTLLIAVSGWARGSDIEESLASGFDHHLSKPVEPRVVADLFPH